MRSFLLRTLINAAALWIAAMLVSGIRLTPELPYVLYVALIFGLINAFIRPIVAFFSCLAYVFTLGLFKFVVNALMLLLASRFAGEYLHVDGFLSALIGGIIISVVSTALSLFLVQDESQNKSTE